MSAAGAALVITIAVGNVMSNPVMPQPEVRHDVTRLYSLEPAAICGNEIEPARYRAAWRELGRAHGYATRTLGTPNPVAVRRSSPWRAATVRAHRLSTGIPGITPDRFALVLKLTRDDGRRLVLVCTHLVSRAWTHTEPTTELRRQLWRLEARRIRAIIRFWRARGVPVVVAGDLNRPTRVRWARRQRVLVNAGLIQVTVVPPAGMRVRAERRREIPNRLLFTDHPMTLVRTSILGREDDASAPKS